MTSIDPSNSETVASDRAFRRSEEKVGITQANAKREIQWEKRKIVQKVANNRCPQAVNQSLSQTTTPANSTMGLHS